jgi:gluconokinase
MIVILMGVAGSGKTTVGSQLAAELGWRFVDGDDFHSATNIEKMRAGRALTDADREEWLGALRRQIDELVQRGASAVVACSALKESYRKRLHAESGDVRFVHLKADCNLIEQRLANRQGHFFNRTLLESQFEALEEPAAALAIDARLSPAEIVTEIRRELGL